MPEIFRAGPGLLGCLAAPSWSTSLSKCLVLPRAAGEWLRIEAASCNFRPSGCYPVRSRSATRLETLSTQLCARHMLRPYSRRLEASASRLTELQPRQARFQTSLRASRASCQRATDGEAACLMYCDLHRMRHVALRRAES